MRFVFPSNIVQTTHNMNMERKPFFPLGMAYSVAAIMGTIIFWRIAHRFFQWMPPPVQMGIALLYLLTILVLIIIAKYKTSRGLIDVDAYTGFWQNAVRYIIALDLVVFGFEKSFGLQFVVPLGMLDDPFSAIPREMLMWAFYGHFRAMVITIACIEIGGSLLLLFRRTRLLGAIILLPLLLNIVLLDYLYLDVVVQAYVTLETLAVLYLILLEQDRLAEFFFRTKSNLPEFNFRSNIIKNGIRLSVIIIPLLLHAGYNLPKDTPQITGKYEVKSLMINNTTITPNACRDTLPTKVFIDRTDFVLGYTDYQRKIIGIYQYNDATKQITVVWHYPRNRQRDTLFAKITPGKISGTKTLEGRMGRDTIKMELLKVAPLN
jgi:hypothetical protein